MIVDVHMTEFREIKNTLGEMEEHDKARWCLLSLCRVKQPFLLLAELDGCGELQCFEAFQEACKRAVLDRAPVPFDEYVELLRRVDYLCAGMYINEHGEDDYLPADEDKSGAKLTEGFGPAHFGNLNAAIIQLLEGGFPHIKHIGNGAEVIMGATFEDYFYDKYGANDAPEIIQDLERIWSDHAFVLSHPSREKIAARMEEYKALRVWRE